MQTTIETLSCWVFSPKTSLASCFPGCFQGEDGGCSQRSQCVPLYSPLLMACMWVPRVRGNQPLLLTGVEQNGVLWSEVRRVPS